MKYAKIAVVWFALALAFYFVIKYRFEANTPPFILTKLEELKADKVLMDSIGGYGDFEFNFNRKKYESGDTLRYKIIIKGREGNVNYQATRLRRNDKDWELLDENMSIQ